MGGEAIKLALAGAVEYLTANPAEARYRDGAAHAVLRAGLVVDVTGPGGEAATTDMVSSVGGTGSAPSPGWLLRAAVASCVATFIAMRAATLDITLESLEVSVVIGRAGPRGRDLGCRTLPGDRCRATCRPARGRHRGLSERVQRQSLKYEA